MKHCPNLSIVDEQHRDTLGLSTVDDGFGVFSSEEHDVCVNSIEVDVAP